MTEFSSEFCEALVAALRSVRCWVERESVCLTAPPKPSCTPLSSTHSSLYEFRVCVSFVRLTQYSVHLPTVGRTDRAPTLNSDIVLKKYPLPRSNASFRRGAVCAR